MGWMGRGESGSLLFFYSIPAIKDNVFFENIEH